MSMRRSAASIGCADARSRPNRLSTTKIVQDAGITIPLLGNVGGVKPEMLGPELIGLPKSDSITNRQVWLSGGCGGRRGSLVFGT